MSRRLWKRTLNKSRTREKVRYTKSSISEIVRLPPEYQVLASLFNVVDVSLIKTVQYFFTESKNSSRMVKINKSWIPIQINCTREENFL